MADFYQKQALSQTPTGQFQYNPQGNVGQMLEQTANKVFDKAEEDANRARKNYSFGLWNETETQMKNAAAEHENDPQGLSQALEKIRGEMESKNLDNESKIEWGARFEMARGTLQNRADANYNALQKRQAVSNAYDSFYNHMDTISTAFDNLLSDEATPNDLGNLTNSLNAMNAILDTRDNTGLYLLPDATRHSMRGAAQKALYNGLANSFARMTPNERQVFMAKMDADEVRLPSSIDSKTNKITEKSLKDIVGGNVYSTFKEFTKDYKEKMKKGVDPEVASTQSLSKISYKKEFDALKKEGKAADYLNIRAALQNDYATGSLSKKDYENFMEQTVMPLVNFAEANELPDTHFFGSDTALERISHVMNKRMPDLDGYTKAAMLSELYRELSAREIDPSAVASDLETIDKAYLTVEDRFMKENNAGLLGKNVASILMNGSVVTIDPELYRPTESELDYEIVEHLGHRYKLYEDGHQERIY